MSQIIRIGIIGDYDGRASHLATEEALKHSAENLAVSVEYQWLPTIAFDHNEPDLSNYNGLWCAPGSPYQSMNGAINAIKYARENKLPFIGTCGGFQHAVIEYGRNVLHISELEDIHFNPYNPNDYITALSCSLVGQTRHLSIKNNSKMHNIYGVHNVDEKYNCSFGINKAFQNELDNHNFHVVGFDEEEEARIMLLEDHPFYVISLFQPQLSSSYGNPHPIIMEYLRAAMRIC
jgi:CTP synthase (UTP-ammonia lyase)